VGAEEPAPMTQNFVHAVADALGRLLNAILLGSMAAAVGLGAWVGLPYWTLPKAERELSELHDLMAPGGPVGVAMGVVGTALMVAMLLYSVRRKLPIRVPMIGSAAAWLRFHIACGIAGPALIAMHAGFTLPEGLIAIGFWCMVLVALSGVFGRWVFGLLPRAEGGRRAAWNEVLETTRALKAELVAATADRRGDALGTAVREVEELDPDDVQGFVDLFSLIRDVRARRRRIRGLLEDADLPADTEARAREVLDGALSLRRGLASIRVAGRALRLWHLFHRPLAAAMYVIVAIHVAGAILFGGSLQQLASLSLGG